MKGSYNQVNQPLPLHLTQSQSHENHMVISHMTVYYDYSVTKVCDYVNTLILIALSALIYGG